jgi:cell division transport system permease protein
MIITLSVISSLIFLSAILNASLSEIKDKVDVNVYFVTSAPEPDILALKKTLEGLPDVSAISYTSRDEALKAFKDKHQNDELTLQALDELGVNPLEASLNIKAKNPAQYESIAEFLQNKPILSQGGTSIVDKVNYFQNKVAIDKLNTLINTSNRLGTIVTLVSVIVSILITLNTIRLAIYISREEISVMRLVGASSFYVRGPFVVVGIIYGALSGILTLLLFYPITFWLGAQTKNFFINFDVFQYYTQNFGQIFLIVVFSGMFIGAVSSYIAVRKYLKV